MEIITHLTNFNVLYMVTGLILGVVLHLWLSIVKSRMDRMESLKTYISSEDLIYDLSKMGQCIPCAILRGYVKEKNLKILDHTYEGVLRQTETEEVYERNLLPQTDAEEEEISFFDVWSHIKRFCGFKIRSSDNIQLQDIVTTVDELESVEFGLIELVGNKWLVEELGPPEDFAHVMRKTCSDVTYLNCNNAIGGTYINPIIRYRTLIKVTSLVRMLSIGLPLTIVGKITVSDFGNVQISRPDKNFNYVITSKSLEAMAEEDLSTELYISGAMLFCGFITFYGAYQFLLQELNFKSFSLISLL